MGAFWDKIAITVWDKPAISFCGYLISFGSSGRGHIVALSAFVGRLLFLFLGSVCGGGLTYL